MLTCPRLKNYNNTLGYVVMGTMLITMVMMYFIDRYAKREAEKLRLHHKKDETTIICNGVMVFLMRLLLKFF